MYHFAVILMLFFTNSSSDINDKNQQKDVLQSVFDIQEFQKYVAYSPRFVSSHHKPEVLMVGLNSAEYMNFELRFRDKAIRVISQEEESQLAHNFFIRIKEFDLKKSKAKVSLSYLSSRLYYEKEQKIVLSAQLNKGKDNQWVVTDYNLTEVSINISD